MRIFVTLDYELYLGEKTGTPINCLIRPMEALCNVADKHDFRYIIFVDAAYLLRLSQLKDLHPLLAKDYETVSEHVTALSKQGHDIQLHFHPQWLYSDYDSSLGLWKLERLPYKLSDLPEEEVFDLFHEAKKLLDSIIGHKTIAFRAGGYCLSSFDKYKELFLREGLLIDSSVARGMFEKTPVHAYDYRNVPKKHIYHFEDNVCKEQPEGRFTELSISSVHWSGLHYLLRVRPIMSLYRPKEVYGDGISIVDVVGDYSRRPIATKLKRIIMPYKSLVSIDAMRSCQLGLIYKEAKSKGLQDLVLIGHPKAASNASVKNLEAFMGQCKQEIYCVTKDIL